MVDDQYLLLYVQDYYLEKKNESGMNFISLIQYFDVVMENSTLTKY